MTASSMFTSSRTIELPPHARLQGFTLRYGFVPGMVITYRSVLTVVRKRHDKASTSQQWASLLSAKVIGIDDSDGGARLVIHNRPLDDETRPTVLYLKVTMFGEPIESTDPEGGIGLILPRMAIAVGSTWTEREQTTDPLTLAPLELVRRYRVDAIQRDQVELRYEADPTSLATEAGVELVRDGEGSFGFDATYGVLTRLDMRTRFTARAGEFVGEVEAHHTLVLTDD